MNSEIKLQTMDLAVGYGGQALLHDLQLQACRGEMICLMGPNGVGKSTLLRALTTLQPPLRGEVLINSRPLYQLSALEVAREISLVLTERIEGGFLTVGELVAMGRYPHTGWAGKLTESDRSVVAKALSTTGLEQLAQRNLRELSDGQRQKAMIARALAQDGDLMILDEPLIHLDVSNKWEIMNLLRQTARDHGKALIMATHEMDLSIKLADKLWLISHSGQLSAGCPEDLILSGAFSHIFDGPNYRFDMNSGGFAVIPQGPLLQLSGADEGLLWTRRALTRAGYQTVKENAETHIKVTSTSHKLLWEIITNNESLCCASIESLLEELKNKIGIKKKQNA